MVDSFKDINFKDAKSDEDINKLLMDNLGIGFAECAAALSASVMLRAPELAQDAFNVAPYGDYSKLMEDKGDIQKFIEEESTKDENWKFNFLEVRKDENQLMELCFFNKSIDDGDVMKGFVFIGLSGKIRHAFAQINL